jgi:hypothetical protein
MEKTLKDLPGFYYLKGWTYSQSRYPKGLSNKKKIAKDYFGFL